MGIQRSSVLSRTSRNTTAAAPEAGEFDGLWLNIGVRHGDDKFARLPMGVPVSALKQKKVYDRSLEENPEYAAETQLVNNIIALIQKNSLALAEGESMPLLLEVVLYRRQEESTEVAATGAELEDLEKAIFGV